MKFSKYIIFCSLFFIQLACAPLTKDIDSSSSKDDLVSELVKGTLSAMDFEENKPTAPNKTSPAWLTFEEIPTGIKVPNFLSGMVFRDQSVWVIDQEGLAHLVIGQPIIGEISPYGTDFLFSSSMNNGEDIFIYNMASGITNQLTNTPDVFERGYKWWPSRDNIIVFNFITPEVLGPSYGYLGAFDIVTGNYLILDDQQSSFSSFALSPDGKSIVYNHGNLPVIYIWNQGLSAFDIADFGLNYATYSAPAWSPDGSKIAFHATGGVVDENTGAQQSATVIIDLENNTALELHKYPSFGRKSEPEIDWHVGGEWLAVKNPGESEFAGNPMEMWVMRADGSEEHNLGFSSNMIWSPDGMYLVYNQWPLISEVGEQNVNIVRFETWDPITIEEMKGSVITDWINIPK